MIEDFSPLTRRLVALGLLAFVVLAALNLAVMVWGGLSSSLDALSDSRFRLAKMEALRARPPAPRAAPIAPDLYFTASSHEEATGKAVSALARAAADAQLSLANVATAPQAPDNPGLLQIAVGASGPEPAVLRFVSEVEKAQPAIRLRSWRIAAAPAGGGLAIEGVAVAAWGRPQ